jgi:transcriptional regulator with XRE-family HTH domain
MSQELLAEKSKLHATHLSDLEQGRGNPTHKTLRSLADALKVPPAYILTLEDIFEKRRNHYWRDD